MKRLIEIGGFCFASLVAGCGNSNSGSPASSGSSGSSSAGESSGAGTSGETSGSTGVSTGAASGASAGSSASGATTDAGPDGAVSDASSEAGLDGALSDASSDAALSDAATATILDPTTCVTIGNDAQACGTPQSYGGKTYAQWATTWFTWVLELPGPDFPTLDSTGAYCATGQSTFEDGGLAAADIFFLANDWTGCTGPECSATTGPLPPPVVRSCTIPANQMLFFPVESWYDDNSGVVDGGAMQSDQVLQDTDRTLAASVTGLTLEVDGVSLGSKVSDFAPYLTVLSQFSYTIPNTPQNICSQRPFCATAPWSGPVTDSWGGGYWILLAPLPAGSHTIHFTAADPFRTLNSDVTYNLTVQ